MSLLNKKKDREIWLLTFLFSLYLAGLIFGMNTIVKIFDNSQEYYLEIKKYPQKEIIKTEREIVVEEIIKQSYLYDVDLVTALDIASCESTFRIEAKNNVSTAKGVYSFTDPTWKWIGAENHQFDYRENIKQFFIWYQIFPAWWEECL